MELAFVKNIQNELSLALNLVENVEYVENCESFNNHIVARVSPINLEECLYVLKVAREFKCAIYPVSTGKNWGFGASVPSTENCILINLSKMNLISEYDSELGTVKIQAGVTQKQLQLFLQEQQSSFRIDVTGSGEDTSILGNALERGLGYQALRHEHLLSLKILLMDGSIVNTGFSRFPNSSLEKCLSYGLGPSISHLFTQSNFGIVLEATFKLMKKCEYECAFSFAVNTHEELQKLSNLIREFFDDSIITSIPKVFDKRRCEVTFCSKLFAFAQSQGTELSREQVKESFEKNWGSKAWTFVTSLAGPREVVQAKLLHIESKLKGFATLRIIDREMLEDAPAKTLEQQLQKQFDTLVLGYLQGIPSNDALMSSYWDICNFDKNPEKPESKNYGFLYITPLFPNSSAHIESYMAVYRDVCAQFDMQPAMTLNYLNSNSIEAVITTSFDKSNLFAIKKAHNFKDELLKRLAERGYMPYRLDVNSMAKFFGESKEQLAWNSTLSKIKNALDPEGLLAPKRYSLG